MKKIYHFNYDYGMAEIKIEVDTNILTTEAAKKILDFYDVFFFCDSRVINTREYFEKQEVRFKEYTAQIQLFEPKELFG